MPPTYGRCLRALELLGWLRDDGEQITRSDRGALWLHAGEDTLSIDYISTLWGAVEARCLAAEGGPVNGRDQPGCRWASHGSVAGSGARRSAERGDA
jgi:hypothetical protein